MYTKVRHKVYDDVIRLVEADEPVLLSGGRGTGKSELARTVAEDLGLKFYSTTLTRQTTLGMLTGFKNITGEYVPSDLYYAVKDGGLMLLEEINGADPNVLLCLNSLDNGYMSFNGPGIIDCHPDFRLMATENPNTSAYTGRAELDASSQDRWDKISVELDDSLEKSLVDLDTHTKMRLARQAVAECNSSIDVTMRDALRYQKRKKLGLSEGYIEKILQNSEVIINLYNTKVDSCEALNTQDNCKTIDPLFKLLESRNDKRQQQPEQTSDDFVPF